MLLKLIKLLLVSKKTFRLPKKNRLIILDETGSNKIADHILGHNDFTIMHPKNNILNVPILVYSLFFLFKYKKDIYEVCFIKYVGAKFALTWIDNAYNYCNILSFIPSCKLGLIQNGRIEDLRFKNFSKNRLKCDYYFVNGSNAQSFFEKNLDANYVVMGSAIANNFELSSHDSVKKIQWISQFRDHNKDHPFHKNYEIGTQFAMGVIKKFCESKKIKLEIISFTGSSQEEQSYDKLIGDYDYTFLKSDVDLHPYDSYSALSSDGIIVGMDSQLLYEAFGLKYRTAFLCFLATYMNDNNRRFAWEESKDDMGAFWSNVPNEKQIFNVLDYLINVNINQWFLQVEKFDGLMKHDPGNLIIRKILNTEGVKLKLLN